MWVRNASFQRTHEIVDWQGLTLIQRFNDVGAWGIDVPYSAEIAAALSWSQGRGIIVERDGDVVVSGPMRMVERFWDAGTDQLTFTGWDDNILLWRCLALPVVDGPPYTDQAYDVRTGPAETIMREYVYFNAGPGARADRARYQLQFAADEGRGATITGRARFQRLIELLQSLAVQGGGLGFRVVQDGSAREFQVYEPEDLSKAAVFSAEMGNLRGYSYSETAAEVNFVWVGGGGEGADRIIRERGNSESIVRHGRSEGFVDRRDEDDTDELEESIDETLESNGPQVTLRIAPTDTAGLAFGTDWGLGDLVGVVVDGSKIDDVIREITIEVDGNGERITPVISNISSPNRVYDLVDRIRMIDGRLRSMERR